MPVANNRLLTDDTGLALVNAIERIAPLQIAPLVVSIPTGQWSGSGNDYYISVSASNVTANSILVPNYDSESAAYLKGPVWCVPAAGSFTIHTSVVPSGTVNIMVQFPGTMGEANYQVLADVYSKSQAVAKADIVNDLTSTATDKPLSANMGKALNDKITIHDLGIFSTKSDFESAILTAITTGDGLKYGYVHFLIVLNDGFGNVQPGRFTGIVMRAADGRYQCNMQSTWQNMVFGIYNNNAWNWEEAALNSKMLAFTDVSIGDITIPSSGYYNISQFKPTQSGKSLLFIQVKTYSAGKGALSIDTYGDYISGNEGTYTNVQLRYFFV